MSNDYKLTGDQCDACACFGTLVPVGLLVAMSLQAWGLPSMFDPLAAGVWLAVGAGLGGFVYWLCYRTCRDIVRGLVTTKTRLAQEQALEASKVWTTVRATEVLKKNVHNLLWAFGKRPTADIDKQMSSTTPITITDGARQLVITRLREPHQVTRQPVFRVLIQEKVLPSPKEQHTPSLTDEEDMLPCEEEPH